MGDANKALLGFIIGAVILGAIGIFLAPQMLAIVGIGVGSSVFTQMLGAGSISAFSSAFTTIMAVSMGLFGGLAGGLIGFASSRKENSPILQHFSSSSIAPINNARSTFYTPSFDFDERNTEKSFVKNYEQEKAAKTFVTSSQLLH